MHVVTHFTFDNSQEYSNFCKHMAAFVPSKPLSTPLAPLAPALAATPTLHPVKSAAVSEKQAETPKKPTFEQKQAAKVEKEKADAELPPDGERLNNEPTYENVKTAILAVAQKYKSKAKSFEILKKFDVEKVTPAIPNEHFEGIIAECQKALDAAE